MATKRRKSPVKSNLDICDFPSLKAVLPPGYDYYIESYEDCKEYEGEKRFNANFRIARSEATKDSMRRWIEEFCSHSLTTYRIERTYPSETKWFIYRVDLRCHHNTKPSSHKRVRTPHKKHTACPAKMVIKIRQEKLSKRKIHEVQLKTHPVEVALYHLHNHLTQKKDALQFRDPDFALVEKFRKMYRAGYKPAAALEIHKRDLHMEYEDDYHVALEDRGLCPDMNWCYRQYYLTTKELENDDTSTKKIKSLEEFVKDYNRRCNEKCAVVKLLNDSSNNLVVALVTPLMKRCHRELTQSGKLVFIDTVRVDYLRCRVYLLLTHSVAGGLPLGVLITSSDCPNVVLQALHMFMNLLSDQGFNGQGAAGPAVFMTQDDMSQHDALMAAFPEAELVVCPYHVVQTAWESLCDSQAGVDSGNRQELFEMVKEMVLAKTTGDLEEKYRKLMTSPQAQFSLKFFSYMEELYTRRYEWAVCLREDLLDRIGSTDNIFNLTVDSLKDKVLHQTKACTLVQLLEFLTDDMEDYYKKKVHCIADNRIEAAFIQRYLQDKKMMESLEIVPYFRVRNTSSGECYDVDMNLGLCSCSVGVMGETCRHQYALSQKLGKCSFMMQPLLDTACKRKLDKIAGVPCVQNPGNGFEGKLEVSDESNVTSSLDVEMRDCDLITSARKQEKELVSKDALDSTGNQINDNIEEQSTNGTFSCLICSKVLPSRAHLARHIVAHNHNKPIVCDICGLGFHTNEDCQHHCLQKHTKEKPYECEVCGKSFAENHYLLEHALVHEQKRCFPCDKCGKLFRSPRCVARHKKRHGKATSFACSHCNESFIGNSDLLAHIDKVHNTVKTATVVEVKDPYHYPDHQEEQEVIIISAEEPLATTALSSISGPTFDVSDCSYQVTLTTPAKLEGSAINGVTTVYSSGTPDSQQVQTVQVYTQELTGTPDPDHFVIPAQQHLQTTWHSWAEA
ncbi:uncharacterized protein [Panulirus ornatus]|uniref:uncharacterized protein isoform X2 n=1 Tax=Panulirus ornatus TaxID=150431 RepID=UPI003A8888A4